MVTYTSYTILDKMGTFDFVVVKHGLKRIFILDPPTSSAKLVCHNRDEVSYSDLV